MVVVVSTLVVTAALQLYQYLNQPLATAAGGSGETTTFTGGRFNLLLVSLEDIDDPGSKIADLTVLTLNESASPVFIVRLPLEAEVEVPQGFGVHQLADVYALGALSKPRANLNLTAQTVRRLLAVPIDGYLLTDAATPNPLLSLQEGLSLRLLPKFFGQLRQGVKTNLTFGSLLQISKLIWEVGSFDSWTMASHELEDVVSLDHQLGEIFVDEVVVGERLKIVVLNATPKPGLATHIARYVRNLGGEVIKIGNFEGEERAKTVLVAAEPSSYSAGRLRGVLGIEEVREEFEGLEERADLTLILGLDSFYNL